MGGELEQYYGATQLQFWAQPSSAPNQLCAGLKFTLAAAAAGVDDLSKVVRVPPTKMNGKYVGGKVVMNDMVLVDAKTRQSYDIASVRLPKVRARVLRGWGGGGATGCVRAGRDQQENPPRKMTHRQAGATHLTKPRPTNSAPISRPCQALTDPEARPDQPQATYYALLRLRLLPRPEPLPGKAPLPAALLPRGSYSSSEGWIKELGQVQLVKNGDAAKASGYWELRQLGGQLNAYRGRTVHAWQWHDVASRSGRPLVLEVQLVETEAERRAGRAVGGDGGWRVAEPAGGSGGAAAHGARKRLLGDKAAAGGGGRGGGGAPAAAVSPEKRQKQQQDQRAPGSGGGGRSGSGGGRRGGGNAGAAPAAPAAPPPRRPGQLPIEIISFLGMIKLSEAAFAPLGPLVHRAGRGGGMPGLAVKVKVRVDGREEPGAVDAFIRVAAQAKQSKGAQLLA